MLCHCENALPCQTRHQQIDPGERGQIDGDRLVEEQTCSDIIMFTHIHIHAEHGE